MNLKEDDWINSLAEAVFTFLFMIIGGISMGIARIIMTLLGLDENSGFGWIIFVILSLGIMALICSLLMGGI